MAYQLQNREHEDCVVCRSKQIIEHPKYLHKHLLICQNCGVIFEKRIPDEREFINHYKTYVYNQRTLVSKATQSSINNLLNQFEKYRKSNKILDLGCGQGDFLLTAKNERGWEVYGSEYSPSAVSLCEAEGIKMQQEPFDVSVFGKEVFDVVLSFEVLEHIYRPHYYISNAVNSLRAGKMLYLTTPNFNSSLRYIEKNDYSLLCYPEHLTFYKKNSMRHLLSYYDLEIIKIITTGINYHKLVSHTKKMIQLNKNYNSSCTNINNDTRQINDVFQAKMSKGLGRFIKSVANSLLNQIGIGDTIKVFSIKKFTSEVDHQVIN